MADHAAPAGFLQRLAARQLGQASLVRPRPRARFETAEVVEESVVEKRAYPPASLETTSLQPPRTAQTRERTETSPTAETILQKAAAAPEAPALKPAAAPPAAPVNALPEETGPPPAAPFESPPAPAAALPLPAQTRLVVSRVETSAETEPAPPALAPALAPAETVLKEERLLVAPSEERPLEERRTPPPPPAERPPSQTPAGRLRLQKPARPRPGIRPPPSGKADFAPDRENVQPPAVQVTIGRLEIRAEPASAGRRPARAAVPAVASLDDYLDARQQD